MTSGLTSSFSDLSAASKPVTPLAGSTAEPDFVPLEPRLLMDATLGWDLGGADDIASLLAGVHDLIEAQVEGFDDFLEQFDDLATAALGVLDVLTDATDAAALPGFEEIEEIADRLRNTMAALRDSSTLAMELLGIDTADDAAAVDLAAKINEAFGSDIVGAADMAETFSLSVFTNNTLQTSIDTLVDKIVAGNSSLDAEAVRTAITTGSDTHYAEVLNGQFGVLLEDITLGGQTLVSFTQNAENGSRVDVAVNLPTFGFNLDSLLEWASGTGVAPFDLSVSSDATQFRFQLGGEIAQTDAGTEIRLHVDNLDFDPLLQFGGQFDTGALDGPVNLGLLSLGLDAVTLAEFRVVISHAADEDLGVSMIIGNSLDVQSLASGELGISTQIQEVGGDEFIQIATGEAYQLAALQLSGTLDLFGAISGPGGAGMAYGVNLALSSVLLADLPSGATHAERISRFLSDASLGFDVDLSESIEDEALRDRMESAIEGLAAMGMDQISQFLADIGDVLGGVLSSSLFNVSIPFTDAELSSILGEISSVFTSLGDLFHIDTTALGFSAESGSMTELTTDVTELATQIDLDALEGVAKLDFVVVTDSGRETVTVTLTGNSVLSSSTATDAEKTEALAGLMNAALAAYGFAVTASGQTLRIGSGGSSAPQNALALVGARRENDTAVADFDFATLGFDEDQLTVTTGVFSEGEDEIAALSMTSAQTLSFTPGDDFADAMIGVEQMIFTAVVDGETIPVTVLKPEDGWYGSDNEPNLEGILAAFETALEESGVPVEVKLDDGSFTFSAVGPSGTSLTFGADPEKLTRAFDLESLMEWVNVRLAETETLAGASLQLTEDGALVFSFPEVSVEGEIEGNFGLSDLGLDALSNLSLSVRVQAALSAKFDAAVGIDLVGFAAALTAGSDADNAIDARRELDEAGDSEETEIALGQALLDNIFFADLALEAQITGSATNITGSANLGLMSLSFGADNAALNFLEIDTQFDFSIIGRDGDGAFSERATLQNIIDAFLYEDAEGNLDVTRGLNTLVGRADLQGGIVTDGKGALLDTDGEATTERDDLRHVDADGYEPSEGEILSQLYLQLGDVKLNVVGIEGLNEGIIDGVALTIDDLARPLDSANYRLLGEGVDEIEALASLGDGDILDSFETILNLVSLAGETLKEKLPFLDQNIPLLNFSLLDAVDFAKDLSEEMKALRADPQSGLAKLETMLEGVFGQDTVDLDWDADSKTLGFGLRFTFLEDYAEQLPFNFDLASLIGDQLAAIVGEDAASILTNLADVKGDGTLVFDPDLTMNFVFGIDLSKTLLDAPELASGETALTDLATVASLVESAEGAHDLRIRWKDADTGESQTVNIDIAGATTLEELVTKINDQLQTAIGDHVSFGFDAETGQITLADSNTGLILSDDVEALFGAEAAVAEVVEGETVLTLAEGFEDFAAGYSFHLAFGLDGESLGAGVDITIPAEEGRTAEGFVEALNAALKAADIDRSEISSRAVTGWTMAVGQLITAELVDGVIRLVGSNFAESIGADPVVFGVSGTDGGHAVTFEIFELGGSNAARLLGFETLGTVLNGSASSSILRESQEIGAPRVYLDTEKSGLKLEFTAGAPDGLNLKLGFGPISINVVNGTAMLSAGADSTDPAHLALGFNDIDGDEHEGQYDFADLVSLVTDTGRSVLDLFNLDVAIGVVVDLAFQDSLGFLNPDEHGLTFRSDLLTTGGEVKLSGEVLDSFSGDLINLWNGTGLKGEFALELPSISDLTDFLSDFNILAFLNDPAAVLNGLDMILDRMQQLFDEYLKTIDLPVVGDAIGSAVTFFTDFRYGVLADAREIANTPKADGTLPTTVDLLTGWFNDKLNEVFNPGNEPIQFIQAALDTEGGLSDSYLYGAINFSAVIFDEFLDIAFDLGLPGFDLAVKEGSGIRITLDYSVNIGFGLNKTGFFLLNDTDVEEIRIGITADAGTFQGSAKLMGVLGIDVDAITKVEGSYIGDGTGEGTAVVTASLGVDLFGDQGLAIIDRDGTANGEEIAIDLGDITPVTGTGLELSYEKLVYLTRMSATGLVAFTFNASVDIQLGLTANIIDPTKDGNTPLLIGGKQIIPSVKTELIILGGYTSADDAGFTFTKVAFEDVRIDASVIYDAIIAPVLDPIMSFIEPLVDIFAWMNEVPFSFVVDALSKAFPIFGVVSSVLKTVTDIANFVSKLNATGGQFVFGTFDFSNSFAGDEATGKLDSSSVVMDSSNSSSAVLASSSTGSTFGVFGSLANGFALELPLLTDPFSAMNILLGKYDQVDLVKVHFTLFNLNLPKTDFVDLIMDEIGAPGWVSGAISRALKFELGAHAYAGLSAGYDLSGIVNFVNTLDPERLLDGVFLDTKPFIDVGFQVDAALNLGIAGLNIGGGANVWMGFNDPNDDGKLRFPELLAILDAGAEDPSKLLGYLFEGEFGINFYLSVWAGIKLGFINLTFDIDIVDLDVKIPFGGLPLPPRLSPEVDNGETAVLAVGSNIGNSMSTMDKDGNDVITLDGPNSPIQINLSNEQGKLAGDMNQNVGGIIIPAGKGNNTVDMSELTTDIPIVVYTEDGNDTIKLPDDGLVVLFLGDGVNTVTANPGAKGTYVIFGGSGADTVDIPGGNVVFFGDGDYGMRDLFVATFADKDLSKSEICSLLGITTEGQVETSGAAKASYAITDIDGNAQKVTLAGFLDDYTRSTQAKASSTADSITTGAGNGLIMTGSGNDRIKAGAGSTGVVKVYAGAGDDDVTVAGAQAFIEGGAGADILRTGAMSSEVWGWGKATGESGLLDPTSSPQAAKLNQLAQRDGADIIIGGAGDDRIFGQLGNDVIEGGAGNDMLYGGLGIDIVGGGTFDFTSVKTGETISIESYDKNTGFGQAVNVSLRDAADGNDVIRGGDADDILIGGGGDDTLYGDRGNDVLLGDFARIRLSANLVAEDIETEFDGSAHAGGDTLFGGAGDDVMVGGGNNGKVDTITDLEGSNVVIGDFGGVRGARLNEAVTRLETFSNAAGGADLISTGAGNDLILAGEGADTITSGTGGDIVLGDLGTIDLVNATVTGTASTLGGDDSITTGNGDGVDVTTLVIAGSGNDRISAVGDGGLILLGDNGAMTLDSKALQELRGYRAPGQDATPEQLAEDAATRARIDGIAKRVEAVNAQTDGNDTAVAGPGVLRAVMGGGDDHVTLGGHENYVLGDDGVIEILSGGMRVTAVKEANAGNDTVLGGAVRDVIAGGQGDDRIEGGEGDNVILGDDGVIELTFQNDGTVTAELSDDGVSGGKDVIVTGDGHNLILAGLGNDTVTSGEGDNTVLGDAGRMQVIREADGSAEFDLRDDSGLGGNDEITTRNGDNLILAGLGDDTVTSGEGDNAVLGDAGEMQVIRNADGSVDATLLGNADTGGDDVITTLNGDNLILAGLGNDRITSGDGRNTLLGDNGVIDLTRKADGSQVATALDEGTTGGDDVILLGDGDNRVLAGLGDDAVTVGDGENVILADLGEIGANEATGVWRATDGNDSVTGGNGRNRVILSGGDDVAVLGGGGNRVTGDAGFISWTGLTAFEGEVIETLTPEEGGEDHITTGSGDDVIFGGTGTDTLLATAGDDVILGDNGRYVAPLDGAVGRVTSLVGELAGDDWIEAGSGNDIVLAGQGDDTVDACSGEDVVFGDSGEVTFVNATDIVTLEMTDIERGGDDLIYADAEDLGDDILMGQAGNDTIRAGGGDDVILGDIALFTFLHPHDRLPGQSAADRMLRLEATRIDIGGDDLIYGGIGNDIAVAGFGADLMYGGDGQDILIGDTAIITRRWVDEAKGGLTEWLTIDTNFAFIQGGYDHIHGEGDHDVMVGNLGPDMFYGDTAEDAIFSDGYAGLFRAWLPQGFEGRAENDQRYLYTSNFAGAGAVDVVSNAQQNAAIGNPLDAVEDGSLGKVLTFPGRNALDPDLWRRTIDMLDEPRMLRAMAQMIAMGADSELLADSMLSSLIEAGLLSGDTDPVMLELLIERLAKVLHQRAQNDAAMGERPLAAE
ncbi:hypothetical protein C5F48_01715 [Cereibacter changlensis JA139]|uniref:Calcium-binding protein n=2 Tax=Cereibacter changlensis TaxID=402884 RepID=A0A2T4JZZ3_9RHOB|nr:calcium-binding protein [Cereibacter changlensis]PTE23456.1 hypothetical protein C5F48_01715 [Cereibacter changlensis JA139]PZX52960.1 Ca2+-binding RTX toxin-like protein [Cereibacter changlensis]